MIMQSKLQKIIIVFLLSVWCFTTLAQTHLIPKPQELSLGNEILHFTSLVFDSNSEFENEIKNFRHFMNENGILENEEKSISINFKKTNTKNPFGYDGAYKLLVSDKILIQANSTKGVFYALQTLKQLVVKEKSGFALPTCEIVDWPAFKIRGFMHDLGRNYQSPELLKEQIDVLAAYKYNVFHMHLTDNPGWRLESKIYPQLQLPEATSRKPGKYYSQQEIKDIIEYCRQRHITVIPEIDIPGHTEAFRKALKLKSMNSPEVQQIIINLINELCSLAPPEIMPYIHLGTDEVRNRSEKVDKGYLRSLIECIEKNNRTYISWWHGIKTKGDSKSIKQLWAQSEPLEGHTYIDSRANYINHLDPLAGIGRLYFQQPCRAEHGDSLRLGGILCCWPDNRVDVERNILIQNAVYPFVLAYSEAIWRGVKSTGDKYWAQLPQPETVEYKAFKEFENRIQYHRDTYFRDKEFPWVKNTEIPWRIIGPFPNNNDFLKAFAPEKEIKELYSFSGKDYKWWDSNLYGGTVHLKHFFGFPSPVKEKEGTVYALNYIYSEEEKDVDFWIGFNNWSRSGGRRGGPSAKQGEWYFTQPEIWVNNKVIEPPKWKQPGLAINTAEVPVVDEDYYYRDPQTIKLQKGCNKFLLKVPFGKDAWKWMFTCVPVKKNGKNPTEVTDLKYAAIIDEKIN